MKENHVQIERFKLTYKSKTIGWLEYESGEWTFYYSEEFQKSSDLQPLANFPHVDRLYKSDALWPFFASRIPGSGQPRMREYIHQHKGKVTNVELLKEFGTSNIANPFRLVSES